MYMYIYVCMGLSVWYQEICDAAGSGEQVLSLLALLVQSIYVYMCVYGPQSVVPRDLRRGGQPGAGTQFTCFTSTKYKY